MKPGRTLGLTLLAVLVLAIVACHRSDPHHVTLHWSPPSTPPGMTIVGYNVYRSTTSGGPYVPIATGVPSPSYDDWLVQNDRTYYYVVTAVNQSKRESDYSKEASAKIPAD